MKAMAIAFTVTVAACAASAASSPSLPLIARPTASPDAGGGWGPLAGPAAPGASGGAPGPRANASSAPDGPTREGRSATPEGGPREGRSAAPEGGPREGRSATPEGGPREGRSAVPDTPTRESRLVARMLRRVESARALAATKPVPGVRLPRRELVARVREHVSRELPPDAIRNEGQALQLFGFVPTHFDYEAAEYKLLEDQLAGYYEPSDGTMYMASDLGEEEATATLAHELVHALQDQRWDLEARSKYRPGDADRAEALSALAEGDATSAMFDVMIARAAPNGGRTAIDVPDSVFVEQIRQGIAQGPGAEAPRVMRASLAAPYVYGTLFVNALRRRGGWSAVDAAWDSAPSTTEQMLHIDKWDAREPALRVDPPSFATLGPGWAVADEDSEGELGARIAFEEWMDAAAAAEAARGWGGDRGVLLRSGDRVAYAWRLRYDAGPSSNDEPATRAYASVARALDRHLGPARATDAGFACRERPDRGPFASARVRNDLIFLLGPARAAAGAWTSAGTCAESRRWIKEIAAAPSGPPSNVGR